MRPTLAVLLAALVLAGPAARGAEAVTSATPSSAPAASLPAITVIRAEMRDIADRVIASGSILPVEEVAVAPEVEGLATASLLVDVGATVAAGDVLATLSDAQLKLQLSQLQAQRASAVAAIAQSRADIEQAKATAEDAARARDRALALKAQGNLSNAQAEQAETRASVATAALNRANQGLIWSQAQLDMVDAQIADMNLRLARTEIRAPVAGTVSARNARIGQIASMAGQPMFMLIRDGALELRAEVAEADVTRLAPGQTVTMRAVGIARPFTGRVRLVEPTVDLATRLGHVRIMMDDPSTVRSGMFATADILVSARRAVTVPVTAISTGPDGSTVMRVEGDRVVATRVEPGIREGGFVEIVSGLAAGDLVVARAGAFVRDGDRISPVLDDAAEAAAPVSN
jgi:HlyD family secretion protein